MAVISTGSFAKALWPGVNAWYQDKYDEHQTEYTEIFDITQSYKNFEEDVAMSSFGLFPVKPEGQGIAYDTEEQGWIARYTHSVFALGFIVTMEEYEDNLYAEVGKRRAERLAFSNRTTKEVVHANILNRGFNSAFTGADGVELFSAVHPNIAGGTFANELATAADLSEASLEQAAIDIMDFTDDRGKQISIMPKKVIVPTALSFEVERILYSVLQNDTANNALNALKSRGTFPEGYVINHYLTDSDAWFIKTNAPDGLKCFQRSGPDFAMDNDFDTMNAKYRAYDRYVPKWSDPRGAYGSPGA